MGIEAENLKAGSMKFALDICALIRDLPYEEPGPTVKRQLAKASTSVAFNYRAACRGRSHAEYTAKIGLVAEESDETLGWLEFIEAARLLPKVELAGRLQEAKELCAIFSASLATARRRQRSPNLTRDNAG